MDCYQIYCTGCEKVIAEAYAKDDSGVAQGNIRDEYYCATCADEDE